MWQQPLSILCCLDLYNINKGLGIMGFKCHVQQYISYIVAVSFIGGVNLSTLRRKTPNLLQVTDSAFESKMTAKTKTVKRLLKRNN